MKYAFFESLSTKDKYYFDFQTDEGRVLLISKGYPDQAACEAGVQLVIEKVSDAGRYQRTEVKADEHFFSLSGDGEKALGISVSFENKADMEEAIDMLMKVNGTNISWVGEQEEEVVEEVEEEVEEVIYRVEENQGPQYSVFMRGKYKIFDIEGLKSNKEKRYYFQFLKEGSVVAKSYIYRNQVRCEQDLQLAIENAVDQHKYKLKKVSETKFYFNLISPEGEVIANSVDLGSIVEMREVITWFLGKPYEGNIEDHLPKTINTIELIPINLDNTKKRVIEPFKSIPHHKIAIESYFNNADQKYYFHFEDPEGIPIIISDGFDSKEACVDGIKEVVRYSKSHSNFETKENEEKHFYFELKTDDGERIIQQSQSYETEDELKKTIVWVSGKAPKRKRIKPNYEEIARVKAELEAAELARLTRERAKAEEERKRREALKRERERERLLREEAARKAAEEERLYREQKKQEEAKIREQNRLRLAEEERKRKEEEERLAEEKRLAEEQRLRELEERKKAEKKRKQEEQERLRLLRLQKKQQKEKEKVVKVQEMPKVEEKVEKVKVASKAVPKVAEAPIVSTETGGGLKKILPFAVPLLLIPLFIWFGLKSCGDTTTTTNTTAPSTVQNTVVSANAKTLGLTAGSVVGNMADFLSVNNSQTPKSFEMDELKFKQNTITLLPEASTQLDNVVKVLQSYPTAKIDLVGAIDETENNEFTQNGEQVSLANARASTLFNVLKGRGISESRMNFQGSTDKRKEHVEVIILSR